MSTGRAPAADAADEVTVLGGSVGPLHGLPVTIKDAIATEGIRSTGGAKELADHVPTEDAPAVARLKAAGAIVFGKTNLPRWSSDVQTYNELFGVTNNPWAFDRITGGSSGGSAAAVAAGFTSFEVGTDIGGSVRIPSHCCGVYGLKPTWGVIPQRGYLDHPEGGTIDVDINVFGPIARSAEDLDLLLSVLAGPEPERAVAWRLELPAAEERSLARPRRGRVVRGRGRGDRLGVRDDAARGRRPLGRRRACGCTIAIPTVEFAEQNARLPDDDRRRHGSDTRRRAPTSTTSAPHTSRCSAARCSATTCGSCGTGGSSTTTCSCAR